jgi:hypothetical protein
MSSVLAARQAVGTSVVVQITASDSGARLSAGLAMSVERLYLVRVND